MDVLKEKANHSEMEYQELQNKITKLEKSNQSLKLKLEKCFQGVSMIKEGWHLLNQLINQYNLEHPTTKIVEENGNSENLKTNTGIQKTSNNVSNNTSTNKTASNNENNAVIKTSLKSAPTTTKTTPSTTASPNTSTNSSTTTKKIIKTIKKIIPSTKKTTTTSPTTSTTTPTKTTVGTRTVQPKTNPPNNTTSTTKTTTSSSLVTKTTVPSTQTSTNKSTTTNSPTLVKKTNVASTSGENPNTFTPMQRSVSRTRNIQPTVRPNQGMVYRSNIGAISSQKIDSFLDLKKPSEEHSQFLYRESASIFDQPQDVPEYEKVITEKYILEFEDFDFGFFLFFFVFFVFFFVFLFFFIFFYLKLLSKKGTKLEVELTA